MIEKGGPNLGRAREGRFDDETKLAKLGNPGYPGSWMDREEIERDEFVGEFTSIFLDRKNIPKTQKMVPILHKFTGPQSPRILMHSKIAGSQKHKIPLPKPINFIQKPQKHKPFPNHTKPHENTQTTPNTTKILTPHTTKDSQKSYVSHNSSPNIWVGQDHPKIVGREIFW